MLCRTLRNWSWWRFTLTQAVCVAVLWGITVLPDGWFKDESPSLTPTAHDLPLSALAANPNVRFEKVAQSQRLSINKKPERSARLSTPIRATRSRPYAPTPQAFQNLPRRHIHAVRIRPSSPDDPSHLYLS